MSRHAGRSRNSGGARDMSRVPWRPGSLWLVTRLASLDIKLIVRDRLLVGMAGYVAMMVVLFRLGFPALARYLASTQRLDLRPWEPLVASYVSVNLSTLIVGMVFGFVLLEQVEDRTIRALQVSPVRLPDILLYRAGAPTAMGLLLTPLVAVGLGFGRLPFGPLLLVSSAGALQAGIVALFIPGLADNRVQAFAMLKILSAAGLIPVVAYFVDEPWQLLAGVYPPYWVLKSWWCALADDSRWLLFLLVGFAGLAALFGWLARQTWNVLTR
ncbi:hypothetical protein ACFL5O_07380 [Myxococcota bacterium]